MTKRLIDVDDEVLEAARPVLGTETIAMPVRAEERARELQRDVVRRGQHRGVSIADLVIAAIVPRSDRGVGSTSRSTAIARMPWHCATEATSRPLPAAGSMVTSDRYPRTAEVNGRTCVTLGP